MNATDMYTYTIVYSVGASIHDERRYRISGIPGGKLGERITNMVMKGKVIVTIERE